MNTRRLFLVLLTVALSIGVVGSAGAVSSYLSSFSSAYPGSASASFGCSLCHAPAGPPSRNSYGAAYAGAGHSFTAIESQDADGDGSTNIVEINAGTNPGDPGSKPAPTPTACTGYTYSAWSACGSNGQQTRAVTASTPAGCSGAPSTAAVLTQSCALTPPACAYVYSAWSDCNPGNRQTRTVVSSSPAGCEGVPLLTQVCNYVAPTPTPQPAINGATLYMQRCSACHGSIQRSQVRGSTAVDIKEAVSEVRKMSFLKFLTGLQVKAIADALVTTKTPPAPPVPSGGVHPSGWLNQHSSFAERNGFSACVSCHGADLKGGTGPSCFTCHSSKESDRNRDNDD